MAMRDTILQEIRRLASTNGGQAPGQKSFFKETAIAPHQWRGRYWARWGDALIEAGMRPNDRKVKLDSDAVLNGVIAGVRHFGRFPTRDELSIYRHSNHDIPSDITIKRHFGQREELIAALIKRATEDPRYADIAPLLPMV
jgi:hypothetical protein